MITIIFIISVASFYYTLLMKLVLFKWERIGPWFCCGNSYGFNVHGPLDQIFGPWLLDPLLRYVKMERTLRSGKLERCSPSLGASAQIEKCLEIIKDDHDEGVWVLSHFSWSRFFTPWMNRWSIALLCPRASKGIQGPKRKAPRSPSLWAAAAVAGLSGPGGWTRYCMEQCTTGTGLWGWSGRFLEFLMWGWINICYISRIIKGELMINDIKRPKIGGLWGYCMTWLCGQ